MRTYPYSEIDSGPSFHRFMADDQPNIWCTICRPIVLFLTGTSDTPKSITINTAPFKGSKRVVVDLRKHETSRTVINKRTETVVNTTVEFLRFNYPGKTTFYIRFNF